MNVSIFGLGYVGAVSAGCLAETGHNIIGIDRDKFKVDYFNQGRAPIIEANLEELIKKNVKTGRLQATIDSKRAVMETEISFVCVGTPSHSNGSINLNYIERVSKDIGEAIAAKDNYHLVVARSTMLPGTIHGTIIPLLEKHSGKKEGKHFGVVCNPEFLREASAVYDFFNPAKTVIGATHIKDGENVAKLYKAIKAPLIHTSIKVAEMIKYVDNSFHALKITFANEIGLICKKLNIDSHAVMKIFCKDTKLNLSPLYLKPGFAFGGSCLPKDLRSITYFGKHQDLILPVLNSINPSNQSHIQYTLDLIKSKEKKKIGFLGFAFKAGTDDLRESPVVALIETLLGQGYEILIYDKNVSLAMLRGANKKFIETKIPHIASLITENMEALLRFADVIVIGNSSDEFENIINRISKNKFIIDLVRISEKRNTKGTYEGLCW
jgi:GDP-mannose 6-dehydrogenase